MLFEKKELHDGGREYKIVIYPSEFAAMKLNEVDLAFFEECNRSKKISDWILALEAAARKIEENEADIK